MHLQNRPDADRLVEQILEKSEGVFLYVERFCEDVRQRHLSLDRPEQFPQGLGGIFADYFKRQFPNLEKFRKDVRPALRAILAAREPLPVEILQRLFNWQDEDLRDFTRPLASLCPVTTEAGHEVIKPYHKSLADWLADEAKAGQYFVSVLEGHKRLAEFGWRQYQTGPVTMDAYSLAWLPQHLLLLDDAERAAEVMTEFGYHYAKLEKLGAQDVIGVTRDFAALARAKLSADLRERAGTWQRFHAEIAHFLHRPGIRPEVELMQKAYDHAETSPVTRGAETWIERNGSKHWWFRKLGRWKEIVQSACVRVLEGHTDEVTSVVLHADGRRAVTRSCLGYPNGAAYEHTVRVWDLGTGACLKTLKGHTNWVTSVELHADGRRAVTSSGDSTVRVWDLDTGACLKTLQGHTAGVTSMELHADGRRAVTSSGDKTVRVWDLDTGECLGVWCWESSFCALALSKPLAHGRVRIAAVCEDGFVHFFELMPPT